MSTPIPVCETIEELNNLPIGFHIEPDGKFVRYIGSEDDECCIVSYYIPIERHNKLVELSRPGTSYTDNYGDCASKYKTDTNTTCSKGHRFSLDTYRCNKYKVGLDISCLDCGYEPFSHSDNVNVNKNVKKEIDAREARDRPIKNKFSNMMYAKYEKYEV